MRTNVRALQVKNQGFDIAADTSEHVSSNE